MASRVVSPFSSGLPPYPTVRSHCSSSQTLQPCSMASKASPLPWLSTSHALAVALLNSQVVITTGNEALEEFKNVKNKNDNSPANILSEGGVQTECISILRYPANAHYDERPKFVQKLLVPWKTSHGKYRQLNTLATYPVQRKYCLLKVCMNSKCEFLNKFCVSNIMWMGWMYLLTVDNVFYAQYYE